MLGDRLGEIHIHDNDGTTDQHLPVGEGNFPFRELLALVRRKNLRPILTIESHSDTEPPADAGKHPGNEAARGFLTGWDKKGNHAPLHR